MSRDIDNRHVIRPGSMTFRDHLMPSRKLHVYVDPGPERHGESEFLARLWLAHDQPHLLTADDLRMLSAWALSAAEWLEKQEKTDGS